MDYVVLDKDPKLTAQYVIDNDLREGCFMLGFLVNEAVFRYQPSPSTEFRTASFTNYILPQYYEHLYLFKKNAYETFLLWKAFLDEYKFRFEKTHPAFENYLLCEEWCKLWKDANQSQTQINFIERKFWRDDNMKPFVQRYIRSTGRFSLQNANTPSIVNTCRAYYKHKLASSRDVEFTNREFPAIFNDGRPRASEGYY